MCCVGGVGSTEGGAISCGEGGEGGVSGTLEDVGGGGLMGGSSCAGWSVISKV